MNSGNKSGRRQLIAAELRGRFSHAELTELLVRQGIPRSVAEQEASAQLGLPNAKTDDTWALAAREEQHLLAGDKLVGALGGKVYRLSQPRPTKQSLGLPDRLYVLAKRGRWYTWEAKASWGRVSEDQQAFAQEMWSLGLPHVVGMLSELQTRFCADGLCVVGADGTIEPLTERDA